MMKDFWENKERLKAHKYFRKKDPWQMFDMVLIIPLQFMHNETFVEDVSRFSSAKTSYFPPWLV